MFGDLRTFTRPADWTSIVMKSHSESHDMRAKNRKEFEIKVCTRDRRTYICAMTNSFTIEDTDIYYEHRLIVSSSTMDGIVCPNLLVATSAASFPAKTWAGLRVLNQFSLYTLLANHLGISSFKIATILASDPSRPAHNRVA